MGGQVSRAGVGVQSRQYSLGHFTRILDILLGSTEEEASPWHRGPRRGAPPQGRSGAHGKWLWGGWAVGGDSMKLRCHDTPGSGPALPLSVCAKATGS